ncbi:MAG: carbohydrate ABC transporter permease [Candidatus Faecivicinus sp.]
MSNKIKGSTGMVKKTTPGGIALTAITLFLAIVTFIPILWMACVSLKTDEASLPSAFHYFIPPFTVNNYIDVLSGGTKVVRWLFNSVGVAVIVTLFTTLFCSMASYAIAKLKFRYRNIIYIYFLVGLMVPGEATIVALFVWANKLHLIDSYWGLILPALAGSMNIIIMSSFLEGIPNDLIEAARIDGAGEFRTYKEVILPLSRTVIVTVSIFTFIGNWNSYLWPYLCAMSEDMFTLPIGIPTFVSQFSVDKTIPMTVNMIASLPILIFFVIFEKQIVKGISLTGIKG